VTDEVFNLTGGETTITIAKRVVNLEVGSAEKTYDGLPLTCYEVYTPGEGTSEEWVKVGDTDEENKTVTISGQANIVSGESIVFTFTGSRIDPTEEGGVVNSCTYKINNKDEDPNYDLTITEGKLTVHKRIKNIGSDESFDADELTVRVTPVEIEGYVGGDSLNGGHSPKLRFSVDMGSIKNNGDDIKISYDNLSFNIYTMKEESGNQTLVDYNGAAASGGIKLNRIRVDKSSDDSYCLFPQLTGAISDTGNTKVLSGDYLELVDTDEDSTGFTGIYTINKKTSDDWSKWYITAAITDDEGNTLAVYPVELDTTDRDGNPVTVKILAVSDEEGMYNDSSSYVVPIQSEAPANTSSTAIAVASEDTNYYTNGDASLGLIGSKVEHNSTGSDSWEVSAIPSLLFDSELSSELYPYYNDGMIQEEISADYSASYNAGNYEIRYLDLVNESDGNARLTLAGEDDTVTVYWPYPEGTDKNSYNFTLLHFKDYDRADALVQTVADEASGAESRGADPEEKDRSAYTVLSTADGSLEATEYGIKFTTHTFSPFVLLWERKSSNSGYVNSVPDTGNNTETVNTEMTDSEDVDKIKDPNTEDDSEIGDEENDRVNSANSNNNNKNDDGDSGTTIIDRVRSILPKTGDSTAVMLWILIMIVCITGATVLVKIGIKKRR
jgi:hypothetical protein